MRERIYLKPKDEDDGFINLAKKLGADIIDDEDTMIFMYSINDTYTPLRAAISFNKTGNTFIGCVDEQDNFKIDKGFSYSEDEVSFLITILTLLSKQKVWDMKFFN